MRLANQVKAWYLHVVAYRPRSRPGTGSTHNICICIRAPAQFFVVHSDIYHLFQSAIAMTHILPVSRLT